MPVSGRGGSRPGQGAVELVARPQVAGQDGSLSTRASVALSQGAYHSVRCSIPACSQSPRLWQGALAITGMENSVSLADGWDSEK